MLSVVSVVFLVQQKPKFGYTASPMAKQPSFSSLRACRHIFKEGLHSYIRLSKRSEKESAHQLGALLKELEGPLAARELEQARGPSLKVHQFLVSHGKKTAWEHVKEFTFAIIIALILAAFVRQMWFELYEIPTGSMRPTFREADNVLVMKDTFGINTPFQTSHLLFDPTLVKRGEIVVITGDKLDLPDVDTVYFGLFPGKRRYVKRCVAVGGDRLYFYGGRIFGLDTEGKPIHEFGAYEHIPFITFEGKIERTRATFYLRHMNIPLGKIQLSDGKISSSQIATANGWTKEVINLLPHTHPEAFFEFWGIGNYAVCRLVEPHEMPLESIGFEQNNARLYLELRHHPTLAKSGYHFLKTRSSYLALNDEQLERIKNALYTARFYVRDSRAYRYTPEGADLSQEGLPLDREVPNGCYEFYNGIAYEIGFGSIAKQLDPSHPIYPHTHKELIQLYNYGINLSSNELSNRYGYFRDGALVTLDAPIVEKEEPFLTAFVEQEKKRAERIKEYTPFLDSGMPTKETIRDFGFTIPEKHYLLLGDNHAMSNDSRFFGAVPQANLQGSPILLFWPPGSRWGAPPQPVIPFFRSPNLIVLAAVALLSCAIYWFYHARNKRTLLLLHKNPPG